MKNEGEFNAHLSKEFKKRGPSLHALKIADKFTIGVSDFIIWHVGTSVGLEVKFIKDWPIRESTKILKHPFAGAQKTFLESLELTRNSGWGAVAVDSIRTVYVFKYDMIPDTGNWTRAEFTFECFKSFSYDNVDEFINHLFDLPF